MVIEFRFGRSARMARHRFLASALGVVALAAAVFAAVGSAGAQQWPDKPVRLVVPFPPGGPSDVFGRLLADSLGRTLNQKFVVDNRAGAGGNIGADVVAKAAPDGYTLLLSPPGPQANNRFLYKELTYDPDKDFTPIIILAEMPLVIVANPKLPVTSIEGLIDYAKKNPGKLNYASPGNGTIGHLAAELFKHMTGTEIVHVPYRGSAPALQDLLAGSVELSVDNLPPYRSHIQSGQIRALGITTEQRWPSLDAVPPIAGAGVPGFRASSWFSLVGPAKLPREIVATLNRVSNDWLKSEEGASRLVELGYRPIGGTPEDHEKFVRADVERWGPIVQKAGIKLD